MAMTTLKRCWILADDADQPVDLMLLDGDPHMDSRDEALQIRRELIARDNPVAAATRPLLWTAPCLAPCCDSCGYTLGEDDVLYHCLTEAQAVEFALICEWTGDDRRLVCPDCHT